MSKIFRFVAFFQFLILCILLGSVTWAQESGTQNVQVILTPEICDEVLRSSSVTSPQYKPGIDVYGRPVAPANVQGDHMYGFEQLSIPLTINPQLFAGAGAAFLSDQVTVGQLDVDILSGHVELNGYPLTSDMTDEIRQACLTP